MSIGVWGAGIEGIAATKMLVNQGEKVFIADELASERPDALPETVDFYCGENAIAHLLNAETVFCSPGVPGVHPFREQLKSAGVKLTSLANQWMQTYGDRTIGVTGTKGKSTTTTLVAGLLVAAGKPAHIGGNIGVPLDTLPAGKEAAAVELSSYQCASLQKSPKIAVITSLYSDHLPWHGSQEQYLADKMRVFGAGCEVLVSDSTVLAQVQKLGVNLPKTVRTPDDALKTRIDGILKTAQVSVMPQNLCLAVLAAEALLEHNLTDAEIHSALVSFQPLPHRLQLVSEARGLRWIDDTLSTVPESVIIALQAFPGEVVLLAGGLDRGINYTKLTDFLKGRTPLPRVITLPSNGKRIVDAYEKAHPDFVHHASSLEEAVKLAPEFALEGATVLLSPGAPSHDLYKNYADKSAHFIAAIRALDPEQ
ncbi:MAG: UDP-N-acetylmuramoyl-L-alanine--D-glutamate ligase [Microbacteriaceae bacterium]|nr:UDP-N-acetylmuramoyl-L-alanine--D-glutamate ligase [Microbacteriaceae bacterium]